MMDESGEWHKSKRPRNETVLKGVDARDGVYKSSFHGIGGLKTPDETPLRALTECVVIPASVS